MTERFCADCHWYVKHPVAPQAYCYSPRKPISPITGEPVALSCHRARSTFYGFCGPEAIHFLAKQPKPKGFFARLLEKLS